MNNYIIAHFQAKKGRFKGMESKGFVTIGIDFFVELLKASEQKEALGRMLQNGEFVTKNDLISIFDFDIKKTEE